VFFFFQAEDGIRDRNVTGVQTCALPISLQSLPIDDDILFPLFQEDIKAGLIEHPMDIRDAWKNSYSENTSQKVWAAKYTARHPRSEERRVGKECRSGGWQ